MTDSIDRTEAMEEEFNKTSGGNFFNYVNSSALERLGITQWKPSVGPNAIRIVFPPSRKGFYGLEVFKHSNIGVNRKTFVCRKRTFDEPCPICDFADRLRKEDSQDGRLDALRAARRYLFFVVDISSEEEEKKGKRWFDCPVTLFNEIKSRSKQKRRRGQEEGKNFKKIIDVSHPTEGRDIEFEQTKESGKYDYVGVQLIEGPPIPEEWYEDLPEFKDILKESSQEEILEAIGDQFSDEGTPADEVDDTTAKDAKESTKEPEPEVVDEQPAEEKGKEEPKEGMTTRSRRAQRESSNSSPEKNEGDTDMQSRVQKRLEDARRRRAENN